jgi:hypothetical protein
MSMGYGDHWARARQAAAGIVRRLQPGDKVALLEFADRTITRVPLTTDSTAVLSAIANGSALTDRPTRYGQGLKFAEQATYETDAGKRIIHLVSDFQKSGWTSDEQDFRLGPNIQLQPVDVSSADYSNLAPADVQVLETNENGKEGLKIRFSIVNFGTKDRTGVRVNLLVDERGVDQKTLEVHRGKVERQDFQLAGLTAGKHSLILEIDDDRLTRDNRFSLTINVRGRTPVVAVENPRAGRNGRVPSFFLARALNVTGLSPFQLTTLTPGQAESQAAFPGNILIWNDIQGGSGSLQDKLRKLVSSGNGLVVVLGNNLPTADFNRTFANWVPVKIESAASSDRRVGQRPSEDYALLTDIRLDHAIFRPFSEPHSGNFSSARFYSHPVLQVGQGVQVVARFDSGDPAVVAADVGDGRVIIMAFSADDSTNDLPLKAVYAPFWQEVLRYLQKYRQERRWVEVGEGIEPRRILAEAALSRSVRNQDPGQNPVILDPDGQRVPLPAGTEGLIVEKAGFYELRTAGLNTRVAVNTVPNESDLTPGNPEEMVAGWASAQAGSAPAAVPETLSAGELERRQSLWRLLLLAALLCFAAEGWLGNRSVLKTE